jgi:hypothetical protein
MPTWIRFALGLVLLFSQPARAGFVNLGVIAFDALIPADPPSPGVNIFNITNLTGDPDGGGFALPPDFPVTTPLTFQNVGVVLFDFIIRVGDLGPGAFDGTGPLSFPDFQNFPSATFIGRLDQTTFSLANGSTFKAASPFVSATIRPFMGSTLEPGRDFAVITVSDIPEPRLALLLGVALATLVTIHARKQSL